MVFWHVREGFVGPYSHRSVAVKSFRCGEVWRSGELPHTRSRKGFRGEVGVLSVVSPKCPWRGEWFFAAALWPFLVIVGAASAEQPEAERSGLSWEHDVAPLLKELCFKCHGSDKREAGLDLRRRSALVRGGDSGPAIVVGQPMQSLLIEMLEDGQMPPPGEPRLSAAQVAVIRQWISSGAAAADPEEPPPAVPEQPGSRDEEARHHWSFQPVRKVVSPRVQDAVWVRTPIDLFTLATLERHGWRPAPPAGREVWLRRVYFDLVERLEAARTARRNIGPLGRRIRPLARGPRQGTRPP